VMFFDTESIWQETRSGELHTLRLWAAWTVIRRNSDGLAGRQQRGWGTTVSSLADYVERSVHRISTLWIVAHNLSFDLGLTRLPEELSRRGWQPQAQSVNPGSAWLRMSRLSKRVTFIDSYTWLPRSLAEIGALVEYVKPDLPANADDLDTWRARCEADVEILGRAMLQLMDWWDRGKLGHWSVTGPASGWNALRHRPDCPRIRIEHDPDVLALERSAIYGGRREAYYIGRRSGGRYRDWDIHAAYPTVALEHALPRERAGSFPHLSLSRYRKLRSRYGIIAKVHLERAGGHVPVRINGEVWYPRGEVVTTLASPEIDRAIKCGCGVTIGPGQIYWMSSGYAGWASWVLDIVDGRTPLTPPVARMAAKHWSRAVIGKFGARAADVECVGDAPTMEWTCEEAHDLDSGESMLLVNLSGKQYAVHHLSEADNSFPAVLAFVESHVRVTVDKLIRTLPHCLVLQVDTDGFLVEELDEVDIAEWAHRTLGVELRCKMEADEVEILGPQHLRIGADRRLAGISRDAVSLGNDTYDIHYWPGLTWQLTSGPSDGYLRPHLQVALKGPYTHRWVLADGRTAAVTAVVRDGRPQILPWQPRASRGLYGPLSASQHPLLERLRSGTASEVAQAGDTPPSQPGVCATRHGGTVPLSAVLPRFGVVDAPGAAVVE